MNNKSKIIIFALLSFCFITVLAHEYILIAHHFKVAKGDTLEVHLFVADGFNVEIERPIQKKMTRRFQLINEKGTIDLLSEKNDGDLPVINRTADFEGLGLIVLDRDYARITLENKKFQEYLKEDHLEGITISKDPAKKYQKERYSRYIKCLVQSGPVKDDTLYKTITGQPFEIILLQNPYKLKPGNTLKVQVFFMGKPYANRTITARNRTGSKAATVQKSRTDKNGICQFSINREGDWFIHATHMIPCPDPADADWESFWASYSFGIE